MYSFNQSNGYIIPENHSQDHGLNIGPDNDSANNSTLFILPATVRPSSEKSLFKNTILARLPGEDLMRLSPILEKVSLSKHDGVWGGGKKNDFVYFPLDVIVSQLSVLKDGSTAEVAMIGNEGMVGLSVIFNSHAPELWTCVVLGGTAMRMRVDAFKREFDQAGTLQQLLLDYAGDYVEQVSQRAVCNSQHKVEKRFATWLLMVHDRIEGDRLMLTQEQIACRLGTRRSSITLAAMALQDQHVISYVRGQILVLDRQRLESAACECYATTHQNIHQNIGRSPLRE